MLTETLKLLHPFMPFITEEIWQALPHSGDYLMLQQWPQHRAELDKLEAKLGNPGFVNKAPAHVVEAEQDRAEKLRALLAKLEESAASMA